MLIFNSHILHSVNVNNVITKQIKQIKIRPLKMVGSPKSVFMNLIGGLLCWKAHGIVNTSICA